MSRYFLYGGFFGFGWTFFITLSTDASVHVALRNGMIGCFVLALLVWYLARVIAEHSLRNKLRGIEEARRVAAEAADKKEEASL